MTTWGHLLGMTPKQTLTNTGWADKVMTNLAVYFFVSVYLESEPSLISSKQHSYLCAPGGVVYRLHYSTPTL